MLQLLMAAVLLVIFTAPWKPLPHWLVMEYSTEQAGAAPDAVTTGTVTDPMRATAPATAASTERGGCRMSDSLQISAPLRTRRLIGTAPTGAKEGSAK